jgi:hypothetical protein
MFVFQCIAKLGDREWAKVYNILRQDAKSFQWDLSYWLYSEIERSLETKWGVIEQDVTNFKRNYPIVFFFCELGIETKDAFQKL